jgi:TusA-related sulfurtransferase
MERLKQMAIRGDKVVYGAYSYHRHNNIYSEEHFEIYRERQDHSLSFYSDIHSRVSTGELLTIHVDIKATKEYIPSFVKVARSLGKAVVVETYTYLKTNSMIEYTFDSEHESHKLEIPTNPKFHISTPAACSSMLFLKSKKEDTTTKNFYNLIQSSNKWKFEHEPATKMIAMQRVSTGTENIVIDGSTVQAIHYRMFEDTGAESKITPPSIKVFLSKFFTVPYIIRSDDGTKIQIKQLKDLDRD